MSKVNPLKKAPSKFVEEQLAGGSGMRAARQDDLSLLRSTGESLFRIY